jgi:hypothetical protein
MQLEPELTGALYFKNSKNDILKFQKNEKYFYISNDVYYKNAKS